MKRILIAALFVFFSLASWAQAVTSAALSRPKLVVGLMVDQMRWDFLYRYYDRYLPNGGFKRILGQGYTCENTFIPYAQTVTAAGHTCVYTGSVPAIHGINGNEWYDKSLGREVYCTEDKNVKTIGGSEKAEPMSPRNLWTTTICDQLRLATNFQSKVIGVAIKDRGGILPAGRSANAAYWYDGASGNWVSSTWYMNDLPQWAKNFNDKKWPDSFYNKDWNTLYPLNSYTQSAADNSGWEGKFSYEQSPVFPHDLKSRMNKDYGTIRVTPYGNTLTLKFAKEALVKEGMGKDAVTDFLAVSLSSPDYIGHQFGPNSIEIEDTYLRLDQDLADMFAFLDKEVGKGQYLFFITADHGVAHVPGFLEEKKISAQSVGFAPGLENINKKTEEKFGIKKVVVETANYQLYLNDAAIDSARAEKEEVVDFIVAMLKKQPEVLTAFDNAEISEANLPKEVKEKFQKGYNAKLSGDIQVILKPGYFYGGRTGTTHGAWYPYDAHIPLVWYGWKVKPGQLNREVYMTDIAPTIAALLKIEAPNGTIGTVITELVK